MRSQIWEDEPPAEPSFRRVQPSVPLPESPLPGMPLEMEDPDGGAPSCFENSRTSFPRTFHRNSSRSLWWRPAGSVGRVCLTLVVLIVLGGLAASAYLLKNYLNRDPRFRLVSEDNIMATGLSEVSRVELLPIFGQDIGRSIFFVPLSERRRQLEQIPWIENATVIRLLPNQIRVSVVERQPVAFTRQGQQIGLVDANGVLLTMSAALMAQHHYSFPVVSGINAGDPLIARKARMAVYQRLLAELDSNGQHISQQISEIDLTDPADARVLMPEQGGDILVHFGEDHFLSRYQRYKDHIAEWRQAYPQLAAVDLRYDQQVVLQMRPDDNTEPSAGQQDAASGDENKPPNPAEVAVNKPATAKPLSNERKTATKPVLAADDKTTHHKPADKQKVGSTGKQIAKSVTRSAAKVKSVKTIGKARKISTKPKTALKASLRPAKANQASLRTVRDNGKGRKRVEVKRVGLSISRHRPALTARRTLSSSSGMGQ
jgi:cell division protein FtsQ